MSQAPHTDVDDLARFGYSQKLDRSLGSFSSFAAGFSYVSILTGMFQTSYLGYLFAGPAFMWAWIAVFAGQLMVALQFAQLSAHYPLAGSVYQWSKRLAPNGWGWMTGWIYLCCQIVTVPAVALAYQVILPQISSSFQFIDCSAGDLPTGGCGFADPAFAKNAIILGIPLILFTTLVNLIGVRLMSQINNVGVAAELIGAVLLIILFITQITRGPGDVLTETFDTGAGHDWGYFGALLLGAYMGLYVMYGFDTAGSLAEETKNPRKIAPIAVLRALIVSAVMGFLLILFGTMAVSDEGFTPEALGASGLAGITTDVFGSTLGKILLIDVMVAITVCCLAIHAAGIRIMFAMSRDNNLPGAGRLAHIGTGGVPRLPAILTGAIAIVVLLFNLVNPYAFTIVVSLGIIFIYLSYLGVTIPLLRKRLAGWPQTSEHGGEKLFSLGGFGVLTNVLAIAWGVIGALNLLWPRADFYGSKWYQQYGPITASITIVVIGLAIWFGRQRHAGEVLAEHRAAAAD